MQGNLPTELNSFVGRRHELREIKRLLGGVRLVTLTGAGGVGKTRLAIQLSRAIKREMPGGTWFVDLASLNDPELVGAAIADALQLRHRSDSPIVERIVEYLAEREALLVLDNCEHVIAAVAAVAEAILKGAPGVKIIATSRTTLRVSGEHVVAVGALRAPHRDQPLAPESASQFDAVSLFVERARAARPGFQLDTANLHAVVDICARVGGIPLAIELAAARLRALAVGQIATYLDERFDLLASRESTPKPRQESIKAVLDWSYGLCSSDEQLLWTRLGVFQSSFDLDAVTSACSGDGLRSADMLDLVCGLVDKSIVTADEISGIVRYQMLESVRAYARERLQLSGTEARVRLRHAHYFLELAADSETFWFTRDEHRSLEALHSERDNLGAAITALLVENDVDSALALATSLGFYWVARGYLHEGNHFLGRTLEAVRPGSPGRTRGLWMAAWVALNRGELSIGDERLDESWSLAETQGDRSCRAHAVELKGLASMLREDWQQALDHYAIALDSHREREDAFSIARTLIRTATVWTLSGRPDQASDLCREAIEITNARGDTWCKGLLLTAMTIIAWEQGNLRDARALATESMRLKLKFNDRLGIAESLEILAWIEAAESNHREAARLLGTAHPLWEAAGGASVQMPREHEVCVRRVWDELGPAEYMSCLEWGKSHGWGDLVGEKPTPLSAKELAIFDRSPLTQREYEVATLVAEGLTNREIAARLVISRRTAEGHIQHILDKLGFTSRTRVASWVAGHDNWA